MLAALASQDGPAEALILYNAALRLWMAGEAASGAAFDLLDALARPAAVPALGL